MKSTNRHRKQKPPSPKFQKRARSQSITDTISEKFKEIEQADATGFLQYMDDQVHDTWDNAKAAMVGAQRLLQFHELPKEWQENEYVLTGYVLITSPPPFPLLSSILHRLFKISPFNNQLNYSYHHLHQISILPKQQCMSSIHFHAS